MTRSLSATRDALHTLHELRRQQEQEATQRLATAREHLKLRQQELRRAHQTWIDRCQPDPTVDAQRTAGSLQRRAATADACALGAGQHARQLRQVRAAVQAAEQVVAVTEAQWQQLCAERQALERTQARHSETTHRQAQRRDDDDDEDLAQQRRPAS